MKGSEEIGNNAQADTYEYLQFGDALFLFLERPVTPLNIAAVSVLEGTVTRDELLKHFKARLPLLSRFTQKVVMAPLNIALPHWESDRSFDLRNHIREVKLHRGTEAEFKRTVAEILSPAMDRNHPLWDVTLIQGLPHDSSGMGHTRASLDGRRCGWHQSLDHIDGHDEESSPTTRFTKARALGYRSALDARQRFDLFLVRQSWTRIVDSS